MRRHLILFSPDGSPVSWRKRLWAKLHNATMLVVLVDNIVFDLERKEKRRIVPRRYWRAHRQWLGDGWVMAVPPLNYVLRLLNAMGGRWFMHRFLLWLGALELGDGQPFTEGRLRWPWCSRRTLDMEVYEAHRRAHLDGMEAGMEDGRREGWYRGRIFLARDILKRIEKRDPASALVVLDEVSKTGGDA